MPRRARQTPAGHVYHVLNRAAGRIALFRKDADYAAFERVMRLAHQRVPPKELARVRLRATRGRPYGHAAWVQQTAQELGIEHTLRREGRPSKAEEQEVANEN